MLVYLFGFYFKLSESIACEERRAETVHARSFISNMHDLSLRGLYYFQIKALVFKAIC